MKLFLIAILWNKFLHNSFTFQYNFQAGLCKSYLNGLAKANALIEEHARGCRENFTKIASSGHGGKLAVAKRAGPKSVTTVLPTSAEQLAPENGNDAGQTVVANGKKPAKTVLKLRGVEPIKV